MHMTFGSLKFFDQNKGFGFIVTDDVGPDVFLHASAVRSAGINPEALVDGTRLSFDVQQDNKGLKAVDIALA